MRFLRLLLMTTALLSFVYFMKPELFPKKESYEKVLGVSQAAQLANLETVRTAVTIYCLENQNLPEKLNDLYASELSKSKYLDLDAIYELVDLHNCDFQLKLK